MKTFSGLVGGPRGAVGAKYDPPAAGINTDLVDSAALAKEAQSPTEAPAAEDNTALYVGLGLVAILAAAWALSSKKG